MHALTFVSTSVSASVSESMFGDASTGVQRFAPDWFLERVMVRAGASEWMFPCRRWLSKDQDDGQTRRTLYARNAEAQIQYKVCTGLHI